MRNYQTLISKLTRLRFELESCVDEVQNWDNEAGQDFRWSVIFLERAMRGLEARRAIQKLMATQVPNK